MSHLHSLSQLKEVDPIVMRRRALIAAVLGFSGSALPAWAATAAETPDTDHTLGATTWAGKYNLLCAEIDRLAHTYVTDRGALDRVHVMDSGLWCFAQARVLLANASPRMERHARRLAAECGMFTAGCHIDLGNEHAAIELYSRAHTTARDSNPDLQAFISAQANWVPMYRNEWRKIERRSHQVIRQAEAHGGPGLLMGYMHLAHACAILGDKSTARWAMDKAEENIDRVPGAKGPSHALHYSATKVYFSSATVYAKLGDAERQNDYQHKALSDPTIGWIDTQLMRLGHASLDPDPEAAARRIRLHLLALPQDSFNHCVKADAERIMNKLRHRDAGGSELYALGHYLEHVQVAA